MWLYFDVLDVDVKPRQRATCSIFPCLVTVLYELVVNMVCSFSISLDFNLLSCDFLSRVLYSSSCHCSKSLFNMNLLSEFYVIVVSFSIQIHSKIINTDLFAFARPGSISVSDSGTLIEARGLTL